LAARGERRRNRQGCASVFGWKILSYLKLR
jgi:hypothetical protein